MAPAHTLRSSNQTSLVLCLSHTCLVAKLKSCCLTNWLHDLHVIVLSVPPLCVVLLPTATWLHTEVLYTSFFCCVCYTVSSLYMSFICHLFVHDRPLQFHRRSLSGLEIHLLAGFRFRFPRFVFRLEQSDPSD